MVNPPLQPARPPELRQRQDMYLANHYLTAHITVVSLALGVAGIAAASLLAPSPSFADFQIVLGILWLASLLATTVAFAGAAIGAIALPPRVPAIVDLAPPLLLGLCEFFLFSILAYQATSLSSPSALITAWWFALGAYGLLAAAQIWRAHHIIDQSLFKGYKRRLRGDRFGATLTGFIGIAVGIIHVIRPYLPQWLELSFAALAVAILAMALTQHGKTARQLRDDLAKMTL